MFSGTLNPAESNPAMLHSLTLHVVWQTGNANLCENAVKF